MVKPDSHKLDSLRFVLQEADTIKPEPIEWVWPQHIPKAKVSLVVGDPGIGKSYILLDMAARISSGRAWPDGQECKRGRVIYMSAEDDGKDTLVPRLLTMNANMKNIAFAPYLSDKENEVIFFRLDKHLPILTELLREYKPACVFLDPLTAYIGPAVNSWVDAEVRSVLGPLSMLAAEFGTAIIGLMHINKDMQKRAIYRVGGSIGFVGAARAVFLAVANGDQRYFGPIKMNLAKFPPVLGYSLDGDPPSLIWSGEQKVDLEEILSEPPEHIGQATEFLRETLSAGKMPAAEVFKLAEQSGVAPRTLKRAKKELNVLSVREGFGQGAIWYWELPPQFASSRGDF